MIILQFSSQNGEQEAIMLLDDNTKPTQSEAEAYCPPLMSLDSVYVVNSKDNLSSLPYETLLSK